MKNCLQKISCGEISALQSVKIIVLLRFRNYNMSKYKNYRKPLKNNYKTFLIS